MMDGNNLQFQGMDDASDSVIIEYALHCLLADVHMARMKLDRFAEQHGNDAAMQASFALSKVLEALEAANIYYANCTRTKFNH